MRDGARNYIRLIWTVFWTAPSLFLILITSIFVWQRPADSRASTGSHGELLRPAFTSPAVSSVRCYYEDGLTDLTLR
jgi:hypothetical protein